MTRTPALVVFDCDGTLVDSQGAIITTVQRACEAEGLPVPAAADVRDHVGLSLTAFVEELMGPLEPERVESLIRRYREQYVIDRDTRGADPLFDGMRELLDALLDQGVMLGVATGKSRRGLEAVIESHDLRRYFVTTQTADDAPSKPHPAMVRQAMDEAGTGPRDTVMIGDSVYDVQAGRAAGTDAIGVAWGSHGIEALLAAGARSVATDVDVLARELGVALPGTS